MQDVHDRHAAAVDGHDPVTAIDRLCELNVVDQALHVCQTTIVRDAWARGQPLSIHGWIYSLRDGLLRDLRSTVSAPVEVAPSHARAVAALVQRS
ncbi:Carbonic anhydrase 2 [compost metagenome]